MDRSSRQKISKKTDLNYTSEQDVHLFGISKYGRRRVVLGHTLNTWQHIITQKNSQYLSKFTTLCWATFIAILSPIWPTGCRLDTPALDYVHLKDICRIFYATFKAAEETFFSIHTEHSQERSHVGSQNN